MKLLLAAVVGVLVSAPSFASTSSSGRYPYYSTQVSCSEIRSAIQREGSLIIYQSPTIYDRYVANASYCSTGFVGMWTRIQTEDGRCAVMYCAQDPR
jgi:hypothetical protein